MLTQKDTQLIMKEIHKPHFARPKEKWDPNVPVIYYEETHTNGKKYDVPLVILRTNPCKWFVDGGCVMCNYELLASHTIKIAEESLLNQLEYAIKTLTPLNELPYLVITSGGSFMDNYEVPGIVRLKVGQLLKGSGLKALSFESEGKFLLDEQKLKEFKDSFGGDISVGIGLESKNDFIRNVMLNKSLTLPTFEKVTKILTKHGYNYYTYILFGKPFLTAIEDIEDAVESILYSYEQGVFMSVIEVMNIQPYTLTHYLWEREEYNPPNLWGTIEVLRRLPSEIAKGVSIKNIEADDIDEKPLDFAKSCPKCTEYLKYVIKEWNYTRNFKVIEQVLLNPCSCYDQWRSTLTESRSESIEGRTEKAYHKIKANFKV